MKKIIVLNHKMTLLYDEVLEYIVKLNNINTNNDIIVCPSSIYLESFINYCNWGVGSQEMHYELSGDYNGEISSLQLKSMGVEYVIVDEKDDEVANKKVIAALESNIIPIVYLYDNDNSVDELYNNFKNITKKVESYEFIILAYHNNKELNLTDMEEKIKELKNMIKVNSSKDITIIYSGDINKDNINKIFSIKEVEGVILGSISSSINEVEDIVNVID